MCQLLYINFLQNIDFILLLKKLALATIKQKIDIIITNFYFKLLINNISFFIFDNFFLEKTNININANILPLIKKVASFKKINTINLKTNIFAIIISIANSRKNYYY